MVFTRPTPARVAPRGGPWPRRILIGLLGMSTFAAAVVVAAWTRTCAGTSCPSIDALGRYDPNQASKVFAADGRLITDLGLERRTVVSLKEMSPAVVQAFLATEDKRFYEHHGIDWKRVFGAVANIVLKRHVTGASTITMQLAGNLFPEAINRRDRSLGRKIREAKVAQAIEAKYPKDKILELYLNQIDLGNRAFGVEAASQRYFGKSARDLNVAEAATLAAIPKGPALYNPRRNPQRSVQRRNLVLGLLRDMGYLTATEASQWQAYPLQLSSRSDYTGVAEYFVEFVRRQLEARFGDDLYRKGLRIYTSLDLDMQQTAERALDAQLTAIEAGKYGKFPHPTYAQVQEQRSDDPADPANPSPYLQGLLVTLEAKTGYIRALIGGRDFDDSKFNRVNQAMRQPGSTFKPIVYSAAVEAGIPLSHVLVDTAFTLDVEGQDPWSPQNYDNKFEGPMSLRHALYQSRNIPAIEMGREIGEQAVIEEAIKFGLTTRIPSVPSIFIGAADVIPLEMVAAYTTFANLGTRTKPRAVLRVEDANGRILWQPGLEATQVMDAPHAWLMTDVLKDVVRKGSAAGSVGGQIRFPAGGKTGTTNDGMDVWFIGFTPELVTGVWMGFDQRAKIMANAQGGRLAAPAWTAMMREVYDRRPSAGDWARPDELIAEEIDQTTGQRATPFCPIGVRMVEWFVPGTEPGGYCPVHGGSLGSGSVSPLLKTAGEPLRPQQALRPGVPPRAAVPPGGAGAMGGAGPSGRQPN
jgi:penicillin-binding protein 1A